MIRELRIKNLALIDDAAVEFDAGFTVFTGETGAGKSVLLGAIGLLLGDRASAEYIRGGANEAEVCGVVELETVSEYLRALLDENNVPYDDGMLILRRSIAANNRNRIYINQVPLPLSVLKKVGDCLIDFHSQHEHQSLLNTETPVRIIDTLPGVAVARKNYTEAYTAYIEAQKVLDEHDRSAMALAEKKDIIEFQYNELNTLSVTVGEEPLLEDEYKLLSSCSERIDYVSRINAVLIDPEFPLSAGMESIRKNLDALYRCDASVEPWMKDVKSAQSVISELESFCGEYLERAGADAQPQRIEFLNNRLAKIQKFKKKYSCTADELVDKTEDLKASLDSLDNAGADRVLLEKQCEETSIACNAAGKKLSAQRKKYAAQFDDGITQQMEGLGFSGGLWQTGFTAYEQPQSDGLEKAVFMVRTNTGEAIQPLAAIASGGEISRLMLAIKTIMAEQDAIPILIFDEIDTGIGGVLAKNVAQALRALSVSHQVLCISHLHQIASAADHQFSVHKETLNGRTVTRIRKLTAEERVDEISRMLGGDSAISRTHAQELLSRR
jgi:DNA repair protein RecN (Recombination protein N)